MTYNVLKWMMTFQVSNGFLMNMQVVHMVPKNSFSLGVIFIWQTHQKLGLSGFQFSQMIWLINFSKPNFKSWWIDDWGHSNKLKYAWNDELKNFPWFYLIMGWGCFMSKAQLMNKWIRVSLGNKPQTLWFALIKMMNWDTWEAYLMDERFENQYHACFHLLLATSMQIKGFEVCFPRKP